MSTETNHAADHVEADLAEAQRLFEANLPFPPDLARRIQERSERMRQETFQRIGTIDEETFQQLLRHDDEP